MKSTNTPAWWMRLEAALLFTFIGLIPLIQASDIVSATWKHELGVFVLPGLALLTKGIGVFMGETPPQNTEQTQITITNKN